MQPTSGWWISIGFTSRPDYRRARAAPEARLLPGLERVYPTLSLNRWYPLHTNGAPHPLYLWVDTPHGLTRVLREHVELHRA
jgi:hypothetical protein